MLTEEDRDSTLRDISCAFKHHCAFLSLLEPKDLRQACSGFGLLRVCHLCPALSFMQAGLQAGVLLR